MKKEEYIEKEVTRSEKITFHVQILHNDTNEWIVAPLSYSYETLQAAQNKVAVIGREYDRRLTIPHRYADIYPSFSKVRIVKRCTETFDTVWEVYGPPDTEASIKKELEAIKALMLKHDPDFNGSKDWRQSDTLGKIDWLIGMYQGKSQEVEMVWEMLNKNVNGNETTNN